ncbi:hypothetical protein J7K56_01495 [Candidatus Calescamantes bacterium]|nr:hypothetical protein [Candidatus Calescamantes bacterium]
MKEVSLREIGYFAERNKSKLRSKRGQVTQSGLNYAVLKFILEYCSPSNWPPSLWTEFERAKHPYKGNYAIWQKYPNLKVNIKEQPNKGVTNITGIDIFTVENILQTIEKEEKRDGSYTFSTSHQISKEEFLDQPMRKFAEYIVDIVERNTISGRRGWTEQLKAYDWPPHKGDVEAGVKVRRNFSYLVNCALEAEGRGKELFRVGICNAVAGWAGLKAVAQEECYQIFSTINYLKHLPDDAPIDCSQIYGRRIALSSKLYCFSDLKKWTIYDSRVAFSLSQFVSKFREDHKDIFDEIWENIKFPIPPTRMQRYHPLNVPWKEGEASLWFVRASLLLREIANILNSRGTKLPEEIVPFSKTWEVYLVEMVFFTLGA